MFTFCGGLVVIALTFTFDILSLNPAEAYSFYVKFVCVRKELKLTKRGRGWTIS